MFNINIRNKNIIRHKLLMFSFFNYKKVTGLHDEMKKMRNEIKKLTNERDYYR